MTSENERIALTMLSGSFEYDSEDSLTVLLGYLKENAPAVDATLIAYQSEDDNPSLELLEEETDVLLVFTRRLNTDGAELERFKSYCDRGVPSLESAPPATPTRTGSLSTAKCSVATTTDITAAA